MHEHQTLWCPSTLVQLPFVEEQDRKSTRLNSSHDQISYAVFCLKKKIYSALFQVGSFSALFGTEYGQTLIVKMGLTVVLVVFGALNQLVWYPRIARALQIVGNTADVLVNLSRRLSRSVRIESILAFGLILIVGLLTALPPAYQVSLTQNRPAL